MDIEKWRAGLGTLPKSPEPEWEWEPAYIRFGDLPPDDRSYDHLYRMRLRGVSCFSGYRTQAGYLVDLQGSPALGIAFLGTRNRRAFVLEGEVVGYGGSGEPLLEIESCERLPLFTRIGTTVKIPQAFRRAWRIGHDAEMARRQSSRAATAQFRYRGF